MSDTTQEKQVEELYAEADFWHVNTGGEIIHAKRMPGQFRTLKWIAMLAWLPYFLGPYLRWGDRQAILFDIPNRRFHIFDITILPQDVWMLSLILLFFAILLAVVTSIAGRVFCGYFCFQTVWTDIFTLIEEKIEGGPAARRKLDAAPWGARKIGIKVFKHAIYILIGVFTGLTFTLWFGGAHEMWYQFVTLTAHPIVYGAVGVFTFFTYLFAAHMREQVCFWLCPYARIQGVMYDTETILPTYDVKRGEPRGKLKRGDIQDGKGDCVDCGQCVAVCPTGIDIRQGQQEGCITCALCIDACDSVMTKVDKPKGLIRYASLDEIEGKPTKKLWHRPRPLIYLTIMVVAATGILYGLTHLGTIELKILHERIPLFVIQSDGSIQNKYYLKLLNKTDKDILVRIDASGPQEMEVNGIDKPILAKAGNITSHTVFARVPSAQLKGKVMSVDFSVHAVEDPSIVANYQSMFMSPGR